MDDNKVPKIPNTGGDFSPGNDWIGPIPAPQAPTQQTPKPQGPIPEVEVYPISKIPVPPSDMKVNEPNKPKPLQVDFPVPQKPLQEKPLQTLNPNLVVTPPSTPTEKTAPANPPTKNIFFTQPTGPAEIDKDQFMPTKKDQFMGGGRMGWPTPPADKDIDKSLLSEDPKLPASIKNIRTFESDVADVLAHKRTSITTMAIAANKKQSGGSDVIKTFDAEPAPHQGLKILMIIIGLLFIGGGIFGAYYLYSKSVISQTQTTIAPQTDDQRPAKLVPIDSQKLVSIDDLSPDEIRSQIKSELTQNQPPNTIRELILTHKKNNIITQVSAQEIIDILKIKVPDTLKRSLTPAWMLGTYTDDRGQTSYFVIMTNNFFQNAFAGMLAWESIMADDIRAYLYDPSIRGVSSKPTGSASQPKVTSTSQATTSTSTGLLDPEQSLAPYPTIHGQFYDKIIQNTDVREFKTTEGRMAFLYTFIDNSRLLVAGNEEIVVEIVKRLENASYMR